MNIRCNHFVGILNDNDDWKLYVNDDVYKQCKLYRGDMEPKKLMRRDCGMSTRFNYCPICGEKIDWNNLLKLIK